ncbi:MAG: 50S ribosomal protein L25/general stress protein Ctc [Bacteroidia bacterium]
MKSIEISGTKRVNLSKQALRELRASGHVPCVLYGGKEQVHFQASAPSFKGLVYTPEVHTVSLSIEGQQFDAKLQEIQFHPVSEKILHADFLQIFPDRAVTMGIPVKLKGTSEGQKQGGRLIQKLKKLQVNALPGKLPDFIEINIEQMKIGDTVKVGDLDYKDLTILDAPNNMVVGIRVTRNVVAETPAPGAAAPAAAAAAAPTAAAAAPAKAAKEKPSKGK